MKDSFVVMHKLHALDGIRIALERCIEQGRVTDCEMPLFACLPGIGIEPPRSNRDAKPLELHNLQAPPGSWSQYVEALFRAHRGHWDLAKLEGLADRGEDWTLRRRNFFVYVLRATERAVNAALRSSQRVLHIHPPLTVDRLHGLMNHNIDRNEDQGLDELPATLKAGEWMLGAIDRDLKADRITESDAEQFRLEIRDFVAEAYEVSSDGNLTSASAEEWLAETLARVRIRAATTRAA